MTDNNDKELQGEVIRILEDRDLTDSERIKALYNLGYNRKQLIEDFHFSKSLVYDVLPVKKELQKEKGFEEIPLSIKSTEVIPPEGIIQRLSDGSTDWQLRLEGMMLLRAAQKMVREDLAIYDSLISAQAKAIEAQLKILKEAKSESEEVALKAATFVAEQIKSEIEEKLERQKPDIASVPNPLEGLMARMMQTAMSNLMKLFFPQDEGVSKIVEKRKREE
jgi:hypothetical protein